MVIKFFTPLSPADRKTFPFKTGFKNDNFLPKINKVFQSPILQNLEKRSVLDDFFVEMIRWAERDGINNQGKHLLEGLKKYAETFLANLVLLVAAFWWFVYVDFWFKSLLSFFPLFLYETSVFLS